MHSYLPLLALAATVSAKTIVINAGQNGLSFSPDTSTADVGDTLEFHFFTSIHTAVQGEFSSPCQMSTSGFFSGPINNKADGSGSVFQVTVKDTNPIWFFCVTPGHCQAGMAGVINPPSSGDSLASYKSSASGTSSSKSGGSVQGGVVAPVPSAGASSSSSPPPSTSAPPPPTSSSKVVSLSAPATSSSSPAGTTSAVAKTTVAKSLSTSASSISAALSTSILTASVPATSVYSTVALSSSSLSTSVSSPTPITASAGAKSLRKVGFVDLMVVGLVVLVGLM